ncbi:MAG: type II toxin-antitoxin system Phd/YefM family antitoxin [Pseudomonadota bacterium]|nr:type II toxin-antitoxin system Phd/YefM family antitoxin [Pseudomonadota bacterium]
MKTVSASEASAKLPALIDEAAENRISIMIIGKHHDAVLISAAEWSAIQETLYLLEVPGMGESIRKGVETPLEQCGSTLGW